MALIGAAFAAEAQVAPSPGEIAAYRGLHAAAHGGDAAKIAELFAAGADPEARDGFGRTPLHVAAHASQDEAVRALAAAGADMNALERQDYDIVTIAAVADDPELVALALALGADPGAVTSPYEGTALIAAAHLGHHEVVRILVEAGAPVDHVNNLGWTALIEAVILGDGGDDHQRTARWLLAGGADPAIADRSGVTPLEHARRLGYDDLARMIAAAE